MAAEIEDYYELKREVCDALKMDFTEVSDCQVIQEVMRLKEFRDALVNEVKRAIEISVK